MRNTSLLLKGFLAGVSMLSVAAHAQEPAKLIVKNAKLFTMAEGQRKVFTGYLVVDAEGKLTAVAAGDPPGDVKAAETWDANGHWILPGFLSAHSHLWQAAFRGLAADKTLPGWIDGLYNQRASKAKAEDYYWFTLDGALDHLEHGITSAYDFSYGGTRWGLCK
jgi:5-methylthioadenosine/S-adenosylhomocysteine deaminase